MLSTKYSVSALLVAVQDLDFASLLELFGFDPVRPLLLHLAVWISAALQGLQRLLERLGHVAVIHHAPPQIDDFVDVLDQQRAFLLTGSACGAGPNLVLRVDAADQMMAVARALPTLDSA